MPDNDAFAASFAETSRYAAEGPPLSSVVVFAYRCNAVALLAVGCWALSGDGKPLPQALVKPLSLACASGTALVIALTYAISSAYGNLPGFTKDDYRLSAAWDRPPATTVAVVGLALALDLLPVIEMARPAPARAARVVAALLTVHGIVTVAASPMSKMRGAHALSTLAFIFALVGYEGAVLATVPPTLTPYFASLQRAFCAGVFGAVFYVFAGFSAWVTHGELFHLSAAEGLALVAVLGGIAAGGLGAREA
mmetsp:Transcript_5626/g.16621  ORF Transcript_5626/g.16621 Transcript_5626/m.16621 type:complete len:252 (-) Transcript_5626:52-807(-)